MKLDDSIQLYVESFEEPGSAIIGKVNGMKKAKGVLTLDVDAYEVQQSIVINARFRDCKDYYEFFRRSYGSVFFEEVLATFFVSNEITSNLRIKREYNPASMRLSTDPLPYRFAVGRADEEIFEGYSPWLLTSDVIKDAPKEIRTSCVGPERVINRLNDRLRKAKINGSEFGIAEAYVDGIYNQVLSKFNTRYSSGEAHPNRVIR